MLFLKTSSVNYSLLSFWPQSSKEFRCGHDLAFWHLFLFGDGGQKKQHPSWVRVFSYG